MPKRLKQLSEELVHKNPYWEYKHDTYTLPNGGVGDYYYAQKRGAVMVVPVTEDGRIVLTLQYRYLGDKQSIEFPAGAIEEESDVLSAAKRELREETGWTAEDWTKVGEFFSNNAIIKANFHVFLAQVNTQHTQELDDSEEIEVLYRRPNEIDDLIISNTIWDGTSLAAWALVRSQLPV